MGRGRKSGGASGGARTGRVKRSKPPQPEPAKKVMGLDLETLDLLEKHSPQTFMQVLAQIGRKLSAQRAKS